MQLTERNTWAERQSQHAPLSTVISSSKLSAQQLTYKDYLSLRHCLEDITALLRAKSII